MTADIISETTQARRYNIFKVLKEKNLPPQTLYQWKYLLNIKVIYKLKVIQPKFKKAFLKKIQIDKLILKRIWKCELPRIAKTILRKQKQSFRTHTTWPQDLL